jgi:phosphoribosylformimino-5-aminoimidazole carboxamide ribotide isomerase
MIVIPAVDISSGKCVRLSQGRKEEKKEYSDNPVEMALKWEAQGAKLLHLIDLDRAIDGSDANVNVIADVVKALKIPVELGGGMRSINGIDWAVSTGVARVIIGTSAIENRRFVQEALKKFNEKIIIGIDAKDDYVAVKGWKEITKIKLLELALEMENIGVKRIIYTDIKRDGMLAGPNINEVKKILKSTNLNVIASGGISSIEDIKKLKSLNNPRLEGVIVGKALYERKFTLKEAISTV